MQYSIDTMQHVCIFTPRTKKCQSCWHFFGILRPRNSDSDAQNWGRCGTPHSLLRTPSLPFAHTSGRSFTIGQVLFEVGISLECNIIQVISYVAACSVQEIKRQNGNTRDERIQDICRMRRPVRPRHTWLRTVEADLQPLNHGLNSAWTGESHKTQNDASRSWIRLDSSPGHARDDDELSK